MTKDFQGWRKSHHSEPNGECVEVGRAPDGTVGVRDTKLRGNGPILRFTRDEWRTFLYRIQMDGHCPIYITALRHQDGTAFLERVVDQSGLRT